MPVVKEIFKEYSTLISWVNIVLISLFSRFRDALAPCLLAVSTVLRKGFTANTPLSLFHANTTRDAVSNLTFSAMLLLEFANSDLQADPRYIMYKQGVASHIDHIIILIQTLITALSLLSQLVDQRMSHRGLMGLEYQQSLAEHIYDSRNT